MTDLATLHRDLEQLKSARRTGARRVRIGSPGAEREVEYRSDRELVAAIAAVESEIAEMEGSARPRFVVVRSSKGW